LACNERLFNPNIRQARAGELRPRAFINRKVPIRKWL
jgi:hypothetical protein